MGRDIGLVHGYTTAFTVGAVILGVGALVSLILIQAKREDVVVDSEAEAEARTELSEVI